MAMTLAPLTHLYRHAYWMLQSSLQIQRSGLSDDGTSRAHHLTHAASQNYLHPVFRLFIVTEYKFTIIVAQFVSFQVLRDGTCSI